MNGVASILVVDDNPKFLADALPMYGYDVTVANDGLEALKILMNKSFDITISPVSKNSYLPSLSFPTNIAVTGIY